MDLQKHAVRWACNCTYHTGNAGSKNPRPPALRQHHKARFAAEVERWGGGCNNSVHTQAVAGRA